jgi:hypothetical protein
MFETELVGLAVPPLTGTRDVLGSNLCRVTDCPDLVLLTLQANSGVLP